MISIVKGRKGRKGRNATEKGGRRSKNLQLQKKGRKSNREEKAQHNLFRSIIPDKVSGQESYQERRQNLASEFKI